MKNLIKYFVQGAILIGPLAATIYILFISFQFLDSLLPKSLVLYSSDDYELVVGDIPGLGIVILAVFLVLLGFLGNTFIAEPVIKYFSRLLNRAPLIKVIYNSVKDLLTAFVGNKKKFNKPVLIKENDQTNLNRIGFITQENLEQLGIENGYSSVYIPHAYAVSGMVFIVENQYIQPLDVNPGDAMKFIISGGVLTKQDKTL